MKRSTLALLLILAAAGALVLRASALTNSDQESRAARVAKMLAGKTFSVSAAVQAAERKTGGTALEAEVELEDGKVIVEVDVLVTSGTPKLLEVEVDGATNEILEIEDEDDDEDDDDDDDDEDDDDDGDDDLGDDDGR